MSARLYVLSLSHPSWTARLMLDRKGIEHRVTTLIAGMHPLSLRAAGFRAVTVPALKLDGRRIQGSLEIARALEAAQPDPPLYPAHAERWRAVDGLIAEGTIGGEEPNAADLQIATTVRVLLAYPELRAQIDARRAGALARRILPDYPDFPASFPPEWLSLRGQTPQ